MVGMLRVTAVALILSVCLSFAACAELSDDARSVLLEQTEALTALMAECAADEAYVKLYLGSNSEVQTLIDKIGKADWDGSPEGMVYVLKDGAVEAFLSLSGTSLKDFSPAVADKVRQSIGASIPSAVAAQSGTVFIAATSVLRTGSAFLADAGFPASAIVFLTYGHDYGVLCSFAKNAENIVSASLIPVPADAEMMLKRVMGLRNLLSKGDSLYEEYPIK